MGKKDLHLTVEGDIIAILNQAKKTNPGKVSQSQLVEFAIRKTYKNKKEFFREKAKEAQTELMMWKDKIAALEDQEKKDHGKIKR